MRKTKIVCTMGPDTSDENVMIELTRNGMDMTRFNFSHGDYNEYQGCLEPLKEVRKKLDTPIVVLLDTKGPEIHTGQLEDGKRVTLEESQTYILTIRELVEDDAAGYINYSGLDEDMTVGNRTLINDGLIKLEVREMKGTDIVCEVINGGELGERKGINVPNVKIKLPVLTDKDKEGIRLGTRQGFDSITVSFVRMADCTREIEAMLDEQGSGMKVTAKVENAGGIENLNAIIETADGIMVVRGDTGVEVSAEKVPYIQKKIIHKCNETCEIVITAAQILGSTIRNPRPIRTEVMDTVSAVYDGASTVMLSGGIAMGKYPVDASKMMMPIASETEMRLGCAGCRQRKVTEQNAKNVSNAVCFVSVSIAHDLGADMIIAPSITGFTTQMLSRWRPDVRITGMPSGTVTVRQMQLQWGVVPVWSYRTESTDEPIESPMKELKDRGFVEKGELAVITAGVVAYTEHYEAVTQANIMRVINIE